MTGSPTACVIIIGNEILSGRTKDANLSFLASELSALGIPVREARVIPDIEDVIVATVNECRRRHSLVFTTGGIGPTHDDITAASVAKALGRPFVRNPEAERRLRAHYRPEDLNEARLKMAMMPDDVILIDNPVSTAPGFIADNVHVLPGVPSILRAMFDGIKHRFQGGPAVRSRTVSCFLREGDLALELSRVQDLNPDVEIGSYPFARDQRLGTSIVMRGTDETKLDATAETIRTMMRGLGGDPIDGEVAGQPG